MLNPADQDVIIPPTSHPRWTEIVTGEHPVPQIENLGLKLLLATIQFRLKRDPSYQSIQRSVSELHGFFARHTWAVADDLRKLFQ